MRDDFAPWVALLPLTVLIVATQAPNDGKNYFFAILGVAIAFIAAGWGLLEIIKGVFRR